MGLINIDVLLKLNRMRDLKVSSNKKNIEVCTDSYRVLKETENYTYENIEVSNDVYDNIQEAGIIDELVRMTFDTKKIYNSDEIIDGEYQYWKGSRKLCDGHYLKYNKVTEFEHPFDLYFRICEKAYFKQFESFNDYSIEGLYEQDHRSQGRLLAFEYLSGSNKKFNKAFINEFNLDITNIDDFKLILLDKELAMSVRKYITRSVAIMGKNVASSGRNKDYLTKRVMENGEIKTVSTQFFSYSLDAPVGDDENCDGYNLVEGVYQDENDIIEQFIYNENEEIKDDNLYKYVLNNIENILTKKQLLYLKAYLNNNENEYLSSISESSTNIIANRKSYKKKIREYISNYLDKDLYTLKNGDKYNFKLSILKSLEYILKQNSNKEIFIALCDTMKNNNDSKVQKVLTDVIYELDEKYYHPIVAYINFNSFFDKYIESDFKRVIYALHLAYNFHADNDEVIYNINANTKDNKVENKMKLIMNNNKEGYISKSKNDNYMSIKQLRDFFTEIEGVKVTNKLLKETLNKYGYDIDLKSSMKKSVEIYFITLLGTEVVKKKVAPKKKRSFNLDIEQSKTIENYIDENLKLDKLLNTTKNIESHLRICDVRSFVENMLDVKRININELHEILLQSNYLLDSKNTTERSIKGLKIHANKIEKVD